MIKAGPRLVRVQHEGERRDARPELVGDPSLIIIDESNAAAQRNHVLEHTEPCEVTLLRGGRWRRRGRERRGRVR